MQSKPVNSSQTKKHEKRLLRLLSKSRKVPPLFSRDEQGCVVHVEDKHYRFENELIETCIVRTLIEATENRIALTDTGVAYLKRLLHPEEPFQRQHGSIEAATAKVEGTVQAVMLNHSESPIFRLYSRVTKEGAPWLSEQEFQAGERLRSDFEKAQLQPRVSANWISSVSTKSRGGGGATDLSDFSLDARRRIEKAVTALGSDLSGVALDICCFLKGLELVEKERGWPPRSAKLMLRTALRELARHYGMMKTNVTAKVERWGANDYRPSL